MRKYLLSGLTGAAALLLVVTPVAASSYNNYRYPSRMSMPSISIENEADINTDIKVEASTGDNEQTARGTVSGRSDRLRLTNTMFTGDAMAYGEVANEVNNGDFCDCFDGRTRTKVELENKADIDTDMEVEAETGDNEQMLQASVRNAQQRVIRSRYHHHHNNDDSGSVVTGDNYLETGDADATGSVWNVVNSQYSMMQ